MFNGLGCYPGVRPVVCQAVVVKAGELVIEECIFMRAVQGFPFDGTCYPGTPDDQKHPRTEVVKAMNTEAKALDGLYGVVVALTDRVGKVIGLGILYERQMVGYALPGSVYGVGVGF